MNFRPLAAAWVANWNARDVAAVLSHFHEDCEFESPIALAVTGKPRLSGKPALEGYWKAALSHIVSLHFTLDDWSWDPAQRILTVFYTSRADGRTTACAKQMVFDVSGKQRLGRAYYGVATTASAA